jgi:hypothetical protein
MQPPRLPAPPVEYDSGYFNQLLNVLRLYFNTQASVQPVQATALNLDVDRLPTQADLPNLRRGDVYRDTTAGDVLKIKT